MRKQLARLSLAVLLLGGSSTGNASVSATIVADCTIAGSTLSFGSYDPLGANSTAALTVSGNALSVACTRGATGVTVTLDNGLYSANASGTTRAMLGGGAYLSYELYSDAAMTTVWNTTNAVSYTPTSMAATGLTVYGSIPGGQNVSVASYTDSVIATVNF